MRTQALLILLLVGAWVGAVSLMFLTGEATDTVSLERPQARADVGTQSELTLANAPRSAREEIGSNPSVDEVVPLAVEQDVQAHGRPEAGVVLRGTVRWDAENEPVPNLRLVADGAGGVRFAVVSDDTGRFESEPVLHAGRLRLWQLGEAPGPAGAARHPKGVRLARETFLVPEEVRDFEVELVLQQPALLLSVEVLDRLREPVEGATVVLETLITSGKGAPEHDVWTQTTDRAGRAVFALYEVERIQALGLFAKLRGAEVSEPVMVSEKRLIDLPLSFSADTTERLVLDEACRLLVRTLDESRLPIPGQSVSLEIGKEPLFAWVPGGLVTNTEGEVLFDGLPPGVYTLGTDAGPGQARETVELTRAVQREIEIVLARAAPRFAVSGVVLDEEGAPLPRVPVTVLFGPRLAAGDTLLTRITGTEGRFEFQAAPCDGLTVLLDGGIDGDEFAPARLSASFADRDLVFRRTRRFPRREFDLEILDAATGERVERAQVTTVRLPATSDYEFQACVGGLLTLVVSEHPDVRLLLDSPGYRRRSIALADLSRSEAVGRLHRVELERGLHRVIEVHGAPGDGSEDSALVGAEVWEGARRLGVTSGDGELTLDLGYWPTQALRIEAPNHRAAFWSPEDDHCEPGPFEIWMERLD